MKEKFNIFKVQVFVNNARQTHRILAVGVVRTNE